MSETTLRKPRRAAPVLSSALASVPVAFMDMLDVGKVHVPGSKREGRKVIAAYSEADGVDPGTVDTDGVDTVKVIMATDMFIMFEAARPKGALDTAHVHPDHHAVAYQKQGRVRMMIGKDWYTIEAGDSYLHPLGVVHQHEPIEDSIRIELKIYPNGGAIAAWNKLVGGSPSSGLG